MTLQCQYLSHATNQIHWDDVDKLHRNGQQRIIGLPELLPTQSQFFVERLRARFPPKEILERLHLFLTPAAFQNCVAISPTFLAIHRILLEIGVEQVATENLGAEKQVSKYVIVEPSRHEVVTVDKESCHGG